MTFQKRFERKIFPIGSFIFRLKLAWILTALMLTLQGCVFTSPQRIPPPASQSPLFLPPTSAPVVIETSITPDLSQPTPTLPCVDGLTFINDLTIPDGSVIQPGASIDKRWEVENSGTCNWESGYSLRLIAGDELGAGTQQALTPARSGTRAVIRILFQAPSEEGNYRSAWQAYNPQNQPFGDPIFIDIVVEP
ncbi:MAG: hypothetical protein KatS3mg047_1266 [Bellilinea sp.]|nr:MAG: hypothetical protein KatS3mg047_1266 [Bellilinea sp.]